MLVVAAAVVAVAIVVVVVLVIHHCDCIFIIITLGCLSAFRLYGELSVLLSYVPVTFHFTNAANRLMTYSRDVRLHCSLSEVF